jgi:hypothetical protein
MASVHTDDLLGRLRRLDLLITAFGHILVSSELERPLPSVIPLLVSENLSEAGAGGLVKEILRRGGAALVADLEDAERMIRGGKKDPEISAVLREVRLAFRQTARLQAGALARKMGRTAQAGAASGPEIASLQKELEAFISGVARAVREDDTEFEEVFADEDLLTDEEDTPAPDDTRGLSADAGGPADVPKSSLYKEEPETRLDGLNLLDGEPRPSTWNVNGPGPDLGGNGEYPSLRPPVEPAAQSEEDQVEPEDDERPLEWLRGRIDVYNEMLARWGAGEAFVPESSPLVRRGTLTPQRCADLYRDLLTAGPIRVVDRIEELEAAPGYADERLRYLRSRIAEGLAAGIPRILAQVASGESLPSDLDDTPGGRRGALASLSAYLTRAVDLFDDASPFQARLRYLVTELRSAIGATPT